MILLFPVTDDYGRLRSMVRSANATYTPLTARKNRSARGDSGNCRIRLVLVRWKRCLWFASVAMRWHYRWPFLRWVRPSGLGRVAPCPFDRWLL